VGVQALWVALVIGIIATVGLMLTARPLAVGLGARDETADVAETYLRIRSLGMVTVLVALAAHGILRGVRDMVTPLRIVAASAIGNVIIEIVMVFGFDWGVAGAAWSTVIAQWAAVIAYLAAIRPHVAGTPRRPDASEMRALLGAGGWLVVRVAALIAALTLGTAFAARSGDATLAAHQIASTLFMVTALGLDALAIPAQTLVAEQLGSGSTSGAHHVAGRVLRSAMRAGVVLGVVVMALAPLAPWMFSSDGDVRAQATRGVLALGVLLIPGAVAFALDGILIGAGRYRELSVDMVQALAVFAIASVPVILRPSLGLVGVWGALTIWMVARAWLTHRTWRLSGADTMTPAVTGTGL
jgi:putative MATE family efflux protein